MTGIQALGIVRFSYIGEGGYQTDHATFKERRQFLFQRDRIEERFSLFEHVTLPGIINQTDKNFILIILISASMPEEYQIRLMQLVDGIEQIGIVKKPPLNHRMAIKRTMLPYMDDDYEAVAQFRLDDDDAVAVDFIEKTKAEFERCRSGFLENGICALDFNQGVLLNASVSNVVAKRCEIKQATAGLVIFTPPEHRRTIIHYPHHRLKDFMPVFTNTDLDMFVRSVNSFNDSLATRRLSENNTSHDPKMESVLKTRFGISIDRVKTAIAKKKGPK